MNFEEKTIAREYKYQGRIFSIRTDKVLLPNGKESTRDILEHNGGVGIVALDGDGKLILIKQFRKPYDEVIVEIPAGKIEKGEDPLECGIRELEEETGYKPLGMEKLTVMYPSPGYSNEKIYIYFSGKTALGHTNFDPDENIETLHVSFEEAIDMIQDGTIKDAKTAIGILLAEKHVKA